MSKILFIKEKQFLSYLSQVVLVAVVVSLSFIYANAVSAATITVSTIDDEIDAGYATDCDPGNENDCSLREAIELSNENGEDDTISLSSGTYTISISGDDDSNQTGDFDIDATGESLIIDGAGKSTVIDGDNVSRVFEISDIVDFTLQDLEITNGDTTGIASAGQGAGLRANGTATGTVTISDVTFSTNIADGGSGDGGAVYVMGSDVVIDDSTFTSNETSGTTANDTGGAIYYDGVNGASDYTMTITDTTFTSNEASGSYGGAIYFASGTMILERSLFDSNSSPNGSAILAYCLDTTINDLYVTNSVFIDNGDGAAIRTSCSVGGTRTGTATIAHSTFSGNNYAVHQTAGEDDSFDITVRGSILANSERDDCRSTVISDNYNIVSDDSCSFSEANDLNSTDPLLADDLENKGGEIQVLSVNVNSDAIDALPTAPPACFDAEGNTLEDDARGLTRHEGSGCEIGAYELDETDPTVSLDPGSVTLQCGVDTYSAPTATVSDNFDTTVTTASEESNNVDEGTAGSYSVVYASTADYDGNIGRGSHPVTVEDTTVPVITVDDTTVSAEAGETYTDAGVSVADSCDESASVSTAGTVDTDTLGEYTLTYTATDSEDNAATEKTRTVTVEDTTVPVITLSGESAVTLTVGDSYTDAGATATDSFEGTLTDDITTAGTVDAETAGTYTITYNVSDSSGNAATEVTRTVTVEAAEEEEPVEEEEETGTDNDVETGEGDGSDDTEETLGAVESLTRSTDSTVLVEYEDGSTKTFQLFSGSAKAKVQLHTNGAILIAINKTYMRTFDAFTGEQIDQVKLFKSKQYKTKFKRFNIYKNAPGKNNVMVLAQTKKKHKKQFKLRSFVVKNGGAITKRPYRTIRLTKNAKFAKLSINKNKKSGKKARILIKKNGKTLKNWKYKVTKKKGILKKAS